jgi:hypothetical protein
MKNFLTFLFFVIQVVGNAQETNYSMGHKAPMFYNPALTGITEFSQANLIYQNRLNNISHSFNSGFSAHLNKIHGGLGIYNQSNLYFFPYEKFTYNRTALNYAFQNNINKNWAFSIGTNIELITRKFKQLDNPFNPNGTAGVTKYPIRLNSNIGGIVYSDRMYFEITGYQIFGIDPFIIQTDLGYKFSLFQSKNISITPSLILRYNKYYNLFSYSGRIISQYKFLYVGAGFSEYMYNLQIGAEIKQFRINYGFRDFYPSFNELNRYQHEIALEMKLFKNIDRKSNAFNHVLF